MTREEAIEIINRENDPNDKKVWELFPEYRQALDMAIKALSQEPKLTGICNECLKKNGCEIYSQLIKSDEKYTVESCEKYIAKPCDAISREAVNTLVDELARAISDERCCISRRRGTATIMRDIYHLPSVMQKSGKWIELPKALNPNENPCKCSECGHILSFMNYYPKSNFCPNCGAKMESEEQTDAT